jgi:hypothetical protein
MYTSLCGHTLSVLLGKYLGDEVLARVWITLQETAKVFTHEDGMRIPVVLGPHQHLLVASVLIIVTSAVLSEDLPVILNCVFLRMKMLSMCSYVYCLIYLYIFCWKVSKCSAPFNWVAWLLIIFLDSLNIIICHIYILLIFSQSEVCFLFYKWICSKGKMF